MTTKIDQAFQEVPRRHFLPASVRGFADDDRALPIGYDQTNSQPSTVRQMLLWLDVKPGQKVLDVGSGSGWTTALLSRLVGLSGKVYAVERIPELLQFGRARCRAFGIKNATFYKAGQKFGLLKHAPFDRILVSASADTLSPELIEQLQPDGVLVAPVRYEIVVAKKRSDGKVRLRHYPGFIFVPLIATGLTQ
jgi:protein-L-isoaspartate(D-aspartate) O-methyltransferase